MVRSALLAIFHEVGVSSDNQNNTLEVKRRPCPLTVPSRKKQYYKK